MRRILFVDDEPEAIARHHCPGLSSDRTYSPLTAVHVAGAVEEVQNADLFGPAAAIDTDYLKRIGCTDRLDSWRQICRMANLEGVIS